MHVQYFMPPDFEKNQGTSQIIRATVLELGKLIRDDYWPQGYKTFFLCSTQLSMKLIMRVNVKMPTTVGILPFISMINTASEHLKARTIFIFQHFRFYEQLKFYAQIC